MIPDVLESFEQFKKDTLDGNFRHLEEMNTPDWDGEGAVPVSPEVIKRARELFTDSKIYPRVTMYPSPDGKISAQWTLGPLEIIISVDASITIDTTIIDKSTVRLPTCRFVDIENKEDFEWWWNSHPIIKGKIEEMENAIMSAFGVPRWCIEGVIPMVLDILNRAVDSGKGKESNATKP